MKLFIQSVGRRIPWRGSQRQRFSSSGSTATKSSRLKSGVFIAGAGILGIYSFNEPQFSLATRRTARSAYCVGSIAFDYKTSLSEGPEKIGPQEYDKRKSEAHQRSAEKLLELCRTNGGIFVKLGQHIAAMVYLLPIEYTSTLRPLWDKCQETPLSEIEKLFQTDAGNTISEMFASFDPKPIGVASIAQVHKAVLKTGQVVAVKIQHPVLDEHVKVDTQTVTLMVRFIKRVFPDFEFGWLADELRESLPLELDFRCEAKNAEKVRSNFKDHAVLQIPKVYDARRRILIMEYIDGANVDEVSYIKKHDINTRAVSTELNKIFSEMIFLHGFVHCDPHTANVFIRSRPKPSIWTRFWSHVFNRPHINPYNFELVLLDHGLYRTLERSFRLAYARLWDALIRSDERGIADASHELFMSDLRLRGRQDGIDRHRLFASMLTGRSWEALSSEGGMSKLRTADEMGVIRSKAVQGPFFTAIAEILAQVPRELLLLLKTADLLRSVDESLGLAGKDQDHMVRMVAVMGTYTSRALYEDEMASLSLTRTFVSPLYFDFRFWGIWARYMSAIGRLYLVRVYLFQKRVGNILFKN
ncbi:hypothetical protein SmJEL517_g04969 [Synchytrium microbalum]|uniref:ABC1 atypical kinase-like domain-containing protein n=1 Tax=Synchytrium microbalum TaxID=1806994 RepID=A0A507C166_9FUNG|nr:uncharacterized protein SmJEL517_g04969 [Synchytrium microbalum]TPX31804.1 hypothetical protein SmJEL517_g04969 [Synchytrium microbalum]